jgi:hypothetical protein
MKSINTGMQFYVLQPEAIATHQQARTDAMTAYGTKYGDAPRCEGCGKFIGKRPWLPPHRVEIETWGRVFGDLAFPTASTILVSLRFKELWASQELSGLGNFEPVEVVKVVRRRKLLEEPPEYFTADVILSRAVVDNAASGIEMERAPTCSVCRLGDGIKRWKAIIIEPGTWGGEDIFLPRWAGNLLVTSKFKDFCDANKITNAIFIPAEEYGHDFCPWEKRDLEGK